MGVLTTAIATVLLVVWHWRRAESPGPRFGGEVGDAVTAPVLDAGGPNRRNAAEVADHEIFAVDEDGAPVAGASVLLAGGEVVLTDGDGVAAFRIMAGEVLRVEKSGFLGVDVTWGKEATHRVVLQRRWTLNVHVSDEFGRPLEGVEVFCADWWYPDRASLVESGAPMATSGALGSATVMLTRVGNHHLHAYHPHWITNSRVSQESTFIEVQRDSSVSLVMAPLQVVAFRPKDMEVLKSELTARGPFDGSPMNRFDRSVIDAAKRDIEARYPGCTAFVLARTRLAPPIGDARVQCKLLIVPAGRVALARTVELVNMDEFSGPLEFTSDDSPASNAFGTVLVECESVPASEVAGYRVLLEFHHDASTDDQALRGYTQRIRFDEVATVPEGRYRMHVPDNALLDMIAVQRGEIVVERGGVTTVALSHEAPLVVVNLTIAMPDGGRCRDFQLQYASASIPGTCTEVITSPKPTLKRWLPIGSYSWRILMAGPSNYETFVGAGEFVVTGEGASVSLPLKLQKG